MPKKPASQKKSRKGSHPKLKVKDSVRYLTVYISKGSPQGSFQVTDSLDGAKTAPIPTPEIKETRTKPPSKSDFSRLQQQIIERIAIHRSLENVIVLLHTLNMDLQFGFQMKPTLQKFAQLIHEDKSRRVYSFDRIHARDILSAIRMTYSGALGVRQLPKLLLTGLVSEYDVFVHELIRTGLMVQSAAVASINRSVSLKELLEFSSITEARDHLIEKEIDSILYDDHHDQLKAINKLFNIEINTTDTCVKHFLEICERRNLFTHNAGVVNTRYVNKCKQFGIDIEKTKSGDNLRVSRTYFKNAIATTQELSIKLIQFVWRKLKPNERDLADDALNEIAVELLAGDDYKLAEQILDYGINHTGKSEDLIRRMMVVNYANAIKLGGDKERAEAELAKYDWSATKAAFQISVAAVKGDIKEVVRQMPLAVKSGDIDESDLRRWPVFKTMRAEKLFQDKYREIFGIDLISVAAMAAKSVSALTKEDPILAKIGEGAGRSTDIVTKVTKH